MIDALFVEQQIWGASRTQQILSHFPHARVHKIERIAEIFGCIQKPYPIKRRSLLLILGEKQGKKIRQAPPDYGVPGSPHFGLLHSYNCPFECEYCYLQGYFRSPDLVFYVNWEAFAQEISQTVRQLGNNCHPWFHAGEYGDSLALAHQTGELPFWFDVFSRQAGATLELRTKSANIAPFKEVSPLPNVITSFTLSPPEIARRYERAPSIRARLSGLTALAQGGFPVAVHFDPIVYDEETDAQYHILLEQLANSVPLKQIRYVTIGALRFPKSVFNELKLNYPESSLLAAPFVAGRDGKIRYSRPLRAHLINRVKQICLQHGITEKQIVISME